MPDPAETPSDIGAAIFAIAMEPVDVGRRVLEGIRRNDMYILTHPEFSGIIQSRCEALLASMPKEPISQERARAADLLLTDKLYSEQIARVKTMRE